MELGSEENTTLASPAYHAMMRKSESVSAMSFIQPLQIQARVIYALILRDTRTRLGRSFIGFILIILWPLSHALALMAGYIFAHQVAPLGGSPTVFIGTGVLPYILCLYPARMTMVCLLQNQQLLAFPVVKPFDIILARGILEIVVAFWVVGIFCAILYVCDINFMPAKPEEAVWAILATIYLGFAIGFVSAVIYKLMRAWLVIQISLLVFGYAAGGAFFLPSSLPQSVRELLWFNPILHSIEWLRSAYYDNYGDGILNRGYLLAYATAILFIGLVFERGARGLLQQS